MPSHLLEKMLEMTDFDEWLSQRSKVVLRRLEQKKIYPNLLAYYLQCYLDPEVTIYFEQCLFHGQIYFIDKKKGEIKRSKKMMI